MPNLLKAHSNWAVARWRKANGDSSTYDISSWEREGSIVVLTRSHETAYSVGSNAYENELMQVYIYLSPGDEIQIFRLSDLKGIANAAL